MKQLLKDIALTLGVFVLICVTAEFCIFPHYSNWYSAKYNYVDTHRDSIRILIMGNSYAENSINPEQVGTGAFDLAVSARWIYYDMQLVEDFVPRMSKLEAVVFPMGYKMPFWSSHHFPENHFDYIDFVHEKYMHCWYDRFPDNVIRWSAIIQGGNEVNVFATRIDVPKQWTGYAPLFGQQAKGWTVDITSDIIDAEDAEEQVQEYTQYLTRMAKVCAENGVRLIVVTPPCHDTFVDDTRPEGIARVHRIIDDVRKEYSIEYKDYLQDPAYRADSLYYNCSHLNDVGATRFGAQIRKDFRL